MINITISNIYNILCIVQTLSFQKKCIASLEKLKHITIVSSNI